MTDDRNLPPTPVTWAYADGWAEEDPAVASARRRAEQAQVPTVDRSTGAALRMLAAALGADAAVEIGTGTGVSGGWLLLGMGDEGTLTTVDSDPDVQAIARETFTGLGVPHTRVRAIAAEPLDVLPRLADGAYDLMVIGPGIPSGHGSPGHGSASSDPVIRAEHEMLAQARRLLRPGGALAVCGALADDGADPAHRDLVHHLREDPRWVPSLLTVGSGMLVAVYRPEPPPPAEEPPAA
ncbi:MAG: O-methyltransferase [bacterium]